MEEIPYLQELSGPTPPMLRPYYFFMDSSPLRDRSCSLNVSNWLKSLILLN